ncbi:hypothetical protein Alches_27800 [Alicyclobacillus hesperidum subsp. aegles]|uniref:sigma-70 family RNA polymerase sigma factor n=1 Tax=Alicyclobacillus hesperidum TaxID=89784 RepID=UPI00222C0B65|nr:sigma-70 family RNA polymerase sigma factor [Alicyclobacillus hesperidum]GLG02739.1 hypothetical protein Alches_27800 [Alicyclobacillus hesperidum subsp. aegles]
MSAVEAGMNFEDYTQYVNRLAKRLIRYRRSAMIDESDLASAALTALWQKQMDRGLVDMTYAKQIIKYAMLEVLRNSNLLKTPRSVPMRQAIQAYQRSVEQSAAEHLATSDPIEEWEQEELIREVGGVIGSFVYEDQLLLSLVFEQGLSFREVAEVLGSTKSVVYHRYRELIAELRTKLAVDQFDSAKRL